MQGERVVGERFWKRIRTRFQTRAEKSYFKKSVIKADAQGAFIRLLYINVVADVLDR